MSRGIKFNSAGTERGSSFYNSAAIKVTNSGGGPSSTTGFYALPTIPNGGYVLAIDTTPPSAEAISNNTDLLYVIGGMGGPTTSVFDAINWTLSQTDIVLFGNGISDLVSGDFTITLNGDGRFIKYSVDDFVAILTPAEEIPIFAWNTPPSEINVRFDQYAQYAIHKKFVDPYATFNDFIAETGMSIDAYDDNIDFRYTTQPPEQDRINFEGIFWSWVMAINDMREGNWFLFAKSSFESASSAYGGHIVPKYQDAEYRTGLPIEQNPTSLNTGTGADYQPSGMPANSLTHYYPSAGPWVYKMNWGTSDLYFYGDYMFLPFYYPWPTINSVHLKQLGSASFGNFGFANVDGFPINGWTMEPSALANMKLKNGARLNLGMNEAQADPSTWNQAFQDMLNNNPSVVGVLMFNDFGFPYSETSLSLIEDRVNNAGWSQYF